MTTTVAAYQALDSLIAECAALQRENAVLRGQLTAARAERDTAKAQLAQYRLVGF